MASEGKHHERVHLKDLIRPRGFFYNLTLFSEGTRRLSADGFKAYVGWLFLLLVVAFVFLSMPINHLDAILAKEPSTTLNIARETLSFLWTAALIWLFIVYTFAFVYRLHDLSLSGFWLLLLPVVSFVPLFVLRNSGEVVFVIALFTFYTLFSIFVFFYPGVQAQNKYGRESVRHWREYPFILLFLAHCAFLLWVIGLFAGAFLTIILGSW